MDAPTRDGAPNVASMVRRRRHIVTSALQILTAWGFEEAEVPLLVPYDEIRDAIDDSVARQLFRFVDQEGRLLTLRGDITPILAWQFTRLMRDRPRPVRVCYANRIARVQRAFASRQTESYVLGMELIGPAGLSADLETLTIAIDVLESLGLARFEVHLGHVGLVEGLLDAARLDGEVRAEFDAVIRRRDVDALRELALDASVDAEVLRSLEGLCSMAPDLSLLQRLAALQAAGAASAAKHLLSVIATLDALGVSDRVSLDLTARHLRSYYTGLHFQFVHPDSHEPIGSGGRYDRLLGHFGDDAPAIGFGLRIDRLVQLFEDRAAPLESKGWIDAALSNNDLARDLRFARDARRGGERVQIVHGGES